jgi:imidazole glycerol phosphate synthase glutamine amidotransferase subunit
MPDVAIIRTGAANLASVIAAFNRLSVTTRIVDEPGEVSDQDAVVLPGVGAFKTGIATLRNKGWDNTINHRFENDLPTLAICLGFQLLCKSSDEDPGSQGLGLLPVSVNRFPDTVTIPQLGWNQIAGNPPFETGFVYFANSFCATDSVTLAEAGWNVATTNHKIDFVAAVARGNWLACQFHPELSGDYGQQLLNCWLSQASTGNSFTTPETTETGSC